MYFHTFMLELQIAPITPILRIVVQKWNLEDYIIHIFYEIWVASWFSTSEIVLVFITQNYFFELHCLYTYYLAQNCIRIHTWLFIILKKHILSHRSIQCSITKKLSRLCIIVKLRENYHTARNFWPLSSITQPCLFFFIELVSLFLSFSIKEQMPQMVWLR